MDAYGLWYWYLDCYIVFISNIMAFSSLVIYIKGYCARPEVSDKGISLFCLSIPGFLTFTG